MTTPEFTLSQLVAIREALAMVIDDGDPQGNSGKEWLFFDSDEAWQIDRRMRFIDAVQEILTRKSVMAREQVRTQIESDAVTERMKETKGQINGTE